MSLLDTLKKPFDHITNRKRREFAVRAKQFTDANPNVLCILGDIDTDVLFLSYKGVTSALRLQDPKGKNQKILHNVINTNVYKRDRSEKSIDKLLMSIDAALFAISKAIYTKRKERMEALRNPLKFLRRQPPASDVTEEVAADPNAVASPYIGDKEEPDATA